MFFAFAVTLVPALGAFAGAAARSELGDHYWTAWDQWFMGDALAQLVITPAIFYWVFGASARWPRLDPKRLIEGCLLTLGLVLTGYVAADTADGPVPFLQTRFYAPIPFLFWAAVRFGMFGASGAVTVLAALVVHAALQGRGPFANLPPSETALALQNYLLLRAAPVYLAAVVIEQRWAIERSLRESQERFHTMADASPVLIWVCGRDKLCEFVNQSWLQFTGRTLQQEIGNGWAEAVHPDDQQRCLQTYYNAFDARTPSKRNIACAAMMVSTAGSWTRVRRATRRTVIFSATWALRSTSAIASGPRKQPVRWRTRSDWPRWESSPRSSRTK